MSGSKPYCLFCDGEPDDWSAELLFGAARARSISAPNRSSALRFTEKGNSPRFGPRVPNRPKT